MDANVALAMAVETEVFINSLRVDDGSDTGAEVLWRQTSDADARSDTSLYHGSAGIIVFLLELAQATGDDSYRQRAEDAGRALAGRFAGQDMGVGGLCHRVAGIRVCHGGTGGGHRRRGVPRRGC